MIASRVVILFPLIETRISHFWIHAFAAILQESGESTMPLYVTNPMSRASENEGIKNDPVGLSEKGATVTGCIPYIISPVNISHARRKFIVTHAISTIARWYHFLFTKAPGLSLSGL